MKDVSEQTRVLHTLTDPVERPTLRWLAERAPAWATPDLLTVVGVGGAALVFAGYALARFDPAFLVLASAGLAVNWLGDSLDGTLARVRHIERPKYGFYLDHTADVIAEALVFLGLGASPFVHMQVAMAAYIGYLGMSVLVYVRACVDGVFRLSYARIGPTELRIVLLAVNAWVLAFGSPVVWQTPLGPGTVFDVVLGVVAAGLGVTFVVSMFRGLREFAGADAPPLERDATKS